MVVVEDGGWGNGAVTVLPSVGTASPVKFGEKGTKVARSMADKIVQQTGLTTPPRPRSDTSLPRSLWNGPRPAFG